MLAIAAARLGYNSHICVSHEHPCAATRRTFTRAAYDDEAALTAFAPGSMSPLRVRKTCGRPARNARRQARPGTRSLAISQDRAEGETVHRAVGSPRSPVARGIQL